MFYLRMLGLLIMLGGLVAFMAGQRDAMGLNEAKGRTVMIALLVVGGLIVALTFLIGE